MELNHRIYELNVQSNLDGQAKNTKVMVNGEDSKAKLSHIFKNVWFETGRIIGYSILEHYTVDDGFLVDKEGNKIHFSNERHPEIKINRIKKPGLLIFGEEEVNWEWVRDTGKLMNLEKTEQTVKGLSDEEINALQSEREVIYVELATKQAQEAEVAAKLKAEEDEKLAEEARKAEEEAETAAQIKKAEEATRLAEEEAAKSEAERVKAEKQAEEAKKAEQEANELAEKAAAEAKAAAEEEQKRKEKEREQYMISQKDYDRLIKKFVDKNIMKVYTNKEYHFFYGANLPKPFLPFVVAKRGDRYEEFKGGIVDETEEEVEFEFEEDGKDVTIILDLENEEITLQ